MCKLKSPAIKILSEVECITDKKIIDKRRRMLGWCINVNAEDGRVAKNKSMVLK